MFIEKGGSLGLVCVAVMTVLMATGCIAQDDQDERLASENCDFGTSEQAVSSYGLYGTVTYNSNQLADGITVSISKKINGEWIAQGTTNTSACGYYTYDTGGTGDFLVYVNAYTWLRPASCGSRLLQQWWMGTSNTGSVTLLNPQKLINLNYVP